MSCVTLFNNFDPTVLRFSDPYKNKKGGQCVNVYQESENGVKKRILIQTPPLTVPFDVSPNKDGNDVIQSYTVNLSFRGADSDARTGTFLQRMRQLDEVLVKAGVARSKEWFGKACKEDVIMEFHSKIVKDPKDATKQYPPTMKVKVPLREPGGACAVPIYGLSPPKDHLEDIKKGSVVRMILELTPVWFINKNMFGVSWRAVQIKVDETPGLADYAFVDDDVSETAPPPLHVAAEHANAALALG